MPRPCSFTIPSRPSSLLCNDAFIFSPYPHRCHNVRACLSPPAELRRLFPLRSPHYLSGCIAFKPCLSVPRTEVARLSPPPLPPAAAVFTSFRYSRSSLHHSRPSLSRFSDVNPSLQLRLPGFPVSILRIFALDTGCPTPLRRLRHAGLFAPFSTDISFALRRSPSPASLYVKLC